MSQDSKQPDVRVLADEAALARAVASAISETIATIVAERGRCSLALSGGSTPQLLYRTLAADFRDRIPWPQVHIFWGDERFVPPTDPRSNFGMAKVTLLDHVPCPASQVHPIPTTLDSASAAADAYDATLRAYFGGESARFDLLLLGIGEDCHTASLFPHAPALTARDRLVVTAQRPAAAADEASRITLTMPVLRAARTVFVLAAGANKAPVLARALSSASTPDDCPASALRRSAGTVVWWTDRAAST
jgi:6-phosphogluconolactonase